MDESDKAWGSAWEALSRARHRWVRRHGAIAPFPDRLRDGSGLDASYHLVAEERAKYTRAEKKRWRRRLSRARHSKHTLRVVCAYPQVPFGEGWAIALYDHEDDNPMVTRAPWLRDLVAYAETP